MTICAKQSVQKGVQQMLISPPSFLIAYYNFSHNDKDVINSSGKGFLIRHHKTLFPNILWKET